MPLTQSYLAKKRSYITSKAVISVTREHKHSKSQDEEQGRQTKNQDIRYGGDGRAHGADLTWV